MYKKILLILTILFTFLISSCTEDEIVNKYQVTFDLGYETETIASIEVVEGNKALRPADPVRERYEFIGWYKEDLTTIFDFETEITEDIVIYAKWNQVKAIVSFNIEIDEQVIVIGEKAVKPADPTKVGHNFIGWFLNEEEFDFNEEITADITLVAEWQIKEFTYIFLDEDGTELKATTDSYGSVIEEPVVENKETASAYLVFTGWDKEVPSSLTEDITFTAVYASLGKIFNVSLDFNNGSPARVDNIDYGDKYNKPVDPVYEGRIFLGWHLNEQLYDFNLPVETSITLVAKWSNPITSILRFNQFNLGTVYVSGVITSFADFNTISIEDSTGAVAFKDPLKDANDYLSLGYQIGDKVIVKVVKYEVDGLIQAILVDGDITLVSSNNELPEKLNINDIGYHPMTLYQSKSKRVNISGMVITNITETDSTFKFVLSNRQANLDLVISKELTTINLSELSLLEIGDVVDIDEALMSWGNGAQLAVDKVNQIIVTDKIIVEGDGEKEFRIFYLNDTHGAILNDGPELGLGRIGNYIKNMKTDNSLFITGGDIFQGQLISNSNRGALMVEIFNELELDAFVIGNHEFDWGLDVVLEYFNPETTGVKANFPILGANVVLRSTNLRPDFIDSHVIVERNGVKIGIIGVIGDGQEGSIAYHRVADYKFTSAYTAVEDTVELIKDDVDFIIVVNHDSNNTFNDRVSALPKVSAIFNGHLHSESIKYIDLIPVVQSRHNGYMVGEVNLTFMKTGFQYNLINSNAKNVKSHQYLNSEDLTIKNIIDNYYIDVAALYEEVIITAARSMSQNDLAYFISRLMKEATNSVAGFQNSGGTRATISNNQQITAADIYQITPFENQIIVVSVTGRALKDLLNDDYFYITTDINYSSIQNNQMYQVATNDYIYYSRYNIYAFGDTYGSEVFFGDMYEVFYQVLLNLKALGYNTFDTNSPIIYSLEQQSGNQTYLYLENSKRDYLFVN